MGNFATEPIQEITDKFVINIFHHLTIIVSNFAKRDE